MCFKIRKAPIAGALMKREGVCDYYFKLYFNLYKSFILFFSLFFCATISDTNSNYLCFLEYVYYWFCIDSSKNSKKNAFFFIFTRIAECRIGITLHFYEKQATI